MPPGSEVASARTGIFFYGEARLCIFFLVLEIELGLPNLDCSGHNIELWPSIVIQDHLGALKRHVNGI